MIHLITTPATIGHCPRCGALVLTGLAEGIRARVDPAPLNRAGHIAAIHARLTTYTLTRTGLVAMDANRIGSQRIRGPTLPQHRCGNSWLPTSLHHTPTSETNHPEGIPY
jgi:hypothetical protein